MTHTTCVRGILAAWDGDAEAARWVGGKLAEGGSWTAGGTLADGATRITDTLGGLLDR